MNIILVINESPWGSTLASTALRLAREIAGSSNHLQAVFFREDGVYNCVPGTTVETGVGNPADSWGDLNAHHGTELMVCQSSAVRRLATGVEAPFREASLVGLTDLVAGCDRVVTF